MRMHEIKRRINYESYIQFMNNDGNDPLLFPPSESGLAHRLGHEIPGIGLVNLSLDYSKERTEKHVLLTGNNLWFPNHPATILHIPFAYIDIFIDPLYIKEGMRCFMRVDGNQKQTFVNTIVPFEEEETLWSQTTSWYFEGNNYAFCTVPSPQQISRLKFEFIPFASRK